MLSKVVVCEEFDILAVAIVVVPVIDVDVELFARIVNTTGTITATDATLATNIVIRILHTLVLLPPRLNNESEFRNDLSLLNEYRDVCDGTLGFDRTLISTEGGTLY